MLCFSHFFVFCKCSKCVVRHLGRPSTSPKNVFKSTLKVNSYLLHTGCQFLAIKGRKTCLSNIVINLNIVVFIFCIFCIFGSVLSVWPATQGSHQHHPKMCVNLQLKQINTFGIQVCLLLALKGRKTCLSNTVINLNIVLFIFLHFWKCSKCMVRHLERPPTSPKNVLKSRSAKHLYLWHTGLLAVGSERTENMPIKHCHQLEYCVFHFFAFLEVF